MLMYIHVKALHTLMAKRWHKMKTLYVTKQHDRENTLAIICCTDNKERTLYELRRLNDLHGPLDCRNSLGGLISGMIDGKVTSYLRVKNNNEPTG